MNDTIFFAALPKHFSIYGSLYACMKSLIGSASKVMDYDYNDRYPSTQYMEKCMYMGWTLPKVRQTSDTSLLDV